MDNIFIDNNDEKFEKIKKYIKYIVFILLVLAIIVFTIIKLTSYKEPTIEEEEEIVVEETDIKEKIKVDIKGAITSPGVYEVEYGKRIIDLINLSGGLTENADTSTINLSKVLEDQMVIIIYTKDVIESLKEDNKIVMVEQTCECPTIKNDACDNNESDKISLTNASIDQLMTLDGIGEAKAKEIIKYREETGFKTIDDLKNISGIGEALFEAIKDKITL